MTAYEDSQRDRRPGHGEDGASPYGDLRLRTVLYPCSGTQATARGSAVLAPAQVCIFGPGPDLHKERSRGSGGSLLVVVRVELWNAANQEAEPMARGGAKIRSLR